MGTDQNNKPIMSLALPGMKAPEFAGMTTGPKGHSEISLKDFTSNGSWCLLIFYPMDFGYISPSELLALNSIKKDLFVQPEVQSVGLQHRQCSCSQQISFCGTEEGGVKGVWHR